MEPWLIRALVNWAALIGGGYLLAQYTDWRLAVAVSLFVYYSKEPE